MKSIKEILMQRDEMSAEEVDDLIFEAQQELLDRIESGDPSAHDICEEYFGLEPDFLMELLP